MIDALANIPSAVTPLERLAADGLAVSIITFGELYEGAYSFPHPDEQLRMFRPFLSGFRVLGLTDEVMEMFARTRWTLRREGRLIPDLDLLIAATARAYDLTLVTRNLRHFERISDLRLYQPT